MVDDPTMLGGASLQETGFAAVMILVVLLAPLAPKLGALIGGLFEKPENRSGRGAD